MVCMRQKGQKNELIRFFPNSVVPSQPSDFKGEAKSETSILLSWVAPPQSGPDNQITGYELVYRRADDTEEVSGEGWVAERIHSLDW